MAFYIKQNDTAPAIQSSLKDGNGDPVGLDGCIVDFHMRDPFTKVVLIDAQASVVSASSGIVQYQWLPADTADTGWFHAEWQVTYANGKVETFPSDTKLWVKIDGEIA